MQFNFELYSNLSLERKRNPRPIDVGQTYHPGLHVTRDLHDSC